MPRFLRFALELSAASIAARVTATVVQSFLTSPDRPYAGSSGAWVSILTSLLFEWIAMRRHVPWASQWALANLGGSAVLSLTMPFGGAVLPLLGPTGRTLTTLAVSQALPQTLVLWSRVPRAWLWFVLSGATVLLRSVALTPAASTLWGSWTWRGQAVSSITDVVSAVALAWLVREALPTRDDVRPAAATSTRLEFLLGWMGAHYLTIGLTAATDTPRPGPFVFPIGLATYGAALCGGTFWVLASAGEDWRAWRWPALGVAAAWIVLSAPPLLLFVFYPLLLTKWMIVGFTIGVASWFSVRRWSWGLVWLATVVVGWTTSLWVPRLLYAAVGASNAYRYPIDQPMSLYSITGLITGLGLLWELRHARLFAHASESSRLSHPS